MEVNILVECSSGRSPISEFANVSDVDEQETPPGVCVEALEKLSIIVKRGIS